MPTLPQGVALHATTADKYDVLLTPEALTFAATLQREFNPTRLELLAAREVRQKRLDAGERPDFLPETVGVRESVWTVAPLPADLLDRRVEITGPVDRKMIINALNSGAKVFMADFEDSTTPTWDNVMEGIDEERGIYGSSDGTVCGDFDSGGGGLCSRTAENLQCEAKEVARRSGCAAEEVGCWGAA